MKSQQTTQKQVTEEQRSTERGQLSTGIPKLDELIQFTSVDTHAAMLAAIVLAQQDHALDEKIKRILMDQLKPVRQRPGSTEYDLEAEFLPAQQWLSFLDGWVAHGKQTQLEDPGQEKTQETNLNPLLATVRAWLRTLTYREKLAITLSHELLTHETDFHRTYCQDNAYPDDRSIGNDLLEDCAKAVEVANSDIEYVRKADQLEVAITAFTAALFPMVT